jgi:TonB family protein
MYAGSTTNGSKGSPVPAPGSALVGEHSDEFLRHFGFRESPFGVTPNPAFLFCSRMHRAALESMTQSIESNLGFTVLLGNPGMGKTTLLLQLLTQYRDSARTAFIFQTQCKRYELLRYLASELELPVKHDEVSLHQRLKEMLVNEARARRKVLIFIDEAQNLHQSSLEAIRLLSDFETPRAKLLHIILAGSSRLGETLLAPELSQLAQRVSTVCRLEPLAPEEVKSYVIFRLRVAGGQDAGSLFSPDALAEVAEKSEGIPRLINSICYRALSIANATGERHITSFLVLQAARELDLSSSPGALASSVVPPALRMEETFGLGREQKQTPQVPRAANPALQESATTNRTQLSSAAISVPGNADNRADPARRDRKAGTGFNPTEAYATNPGPARRTPPQRAIAARGFSLKRWNVNTHRSALALMVTVLLLLVFGLWASWYELRGGSSAVKQDSASGTPTGRASTDADNKELTSLLPEMLALHSPAVPDSVVSRKGVGGNRAPALIQTLPQDQPSKIHLSPADPDQRVLHSAASNRAVMMSNEVVPPILTNPIQLPVVPQLSSQSNRLEPALTSEPADQHQPFPRKAIKVVSPKYPKLAELRHIEGDVLLELYIDSSGNVQKVRAVSGNSALTEAAQEAVRQWRYTPVQNDQPSSASVTWVRFTFKLNPEAKR